MASTSKSLDTEVNNLREKLSDARRRRAFERLGITEQGDENHGPFQRKLSEYEREIQAVRDKLRKSPEHTRPFRPISMADLNIHKHDKSPSPAKFLDTVAAPQSPGIEVPKPTQPQIESTVSTKRSPFMKEFSKVMRQITAGTSPKQKADMNIGANTAIATSRQCSTKHAWSIWKTVTMRSLRNRRLLLRFAERARLARATTALFRWRSTAHWTQVRRLRQEKSKREEDVRTKLDEVQSDFNNAIKAYEDECNRLEQTVEEQNLDIAALRKELEQTVEDGRVLLEGADATEAINEELRSKLEEAAGEIDRLEEKICSLSVSSSALLTPLPEEHEEDSSTYSEVLEGKLSTVLMEKEAVEKELNSMRLKFKDFEKSAAEDTEAARNEIAKRTMENVSLSEQVEKLKGSLEALLEESNADVSRKESSAHVDDLKAQVLEVSEERDRIQRQMENLQVETDRVKTEFSRMEKEIASRDALQMAVIDAQKHALASERECAEEVFNRLNNQVNGHVDRLDAAEHKVSALREAFASERQRCDSIDETRQELAASMKREETLSEQIHELQTLVRDEVTRRSNTEAELATVRSELENLAQTKNVLSQQLESLQSDHNLALEERFEIATSFEKAKEFEDEIQRELEQLRKDFSSLTDAHVALGKEADSLRDEVSLYADERNKLRSVLKEKEKARRQFDRDTEFFSEVWSEIKSLESKVDDAESRLVIAEEESAASREHAMALVDELVCVRGLLAQGTEGTTSKAIDAELETTDGSNLSSSMMSTASVGSATSADPAGKLSSLRYLASIRNSMTQYNNTLRESAHAYVILSVLLEEAEEIEKNQALTPKLVAPDHSVSRVVSGIKRIEKRRDALVSRILASSKRAMVSSGLRSSESVSSLVKNLLATLVDGQKHAHGAVKVLEDQLAAREKEVSILSGKLEELNKEKDDEVLELVRKVEELDEQNSDNIVYLKSLEDALSATEEERDAATQKVKALASSATETDSKHEELESLLLKAQTDLSEYKRSMQSLEQESAEKSRQAENAIEQSNKLELELEHIREEVKKLQEEALRFADERQELQQQNEDQVGLMEGAQELLGALEKENEELRQRIADMLSGRNVVSMDEYDCLSKELQVYRESMSAVRSRCITVLSSASIRMKEVVSDLGNNVREVTSTYSTLVEDVSFCASHSDSICGDVRGGMEKLEALLGEARPAVEEFEELSSRCKRETTSFQESLRENTEPSSGFEDISCLLSESIVVEGFLCSALRSCSRVHSLLASIRSVTAEMKGKATPAKSGASAKSSSLVSRETASREQVRRLYLQDFERKHLSTSPSTDFEPANEGLPTPHAAATLSYDKEAADEAVIEDFARSFEKSLNELSGSAKKKSRNDAIIGGSSRSSGNIKFSISKVNGVADASRVSSIPHVDTKQVDSGTSNLKTELLRQKRESLRNQLRCLRRESANFSNNCDDN